MPSKRFQFIAATLALATVLGGCSLSPHEESSSTPPPPGPVESPTDDATMKEVVDPAKQIVVVAALQQVSGGFGFEACNDQGEPPYRGKVEVGFRIPDGIEPQAYFAQVAKTMVEQGNGWSDGPPPGKNPFGTVIHTDTVFAIIGQNPVEREVGYVHVFGECRNMADHRGSKSIIVTDQLLNR